MLDANMLQLRIQSVEHTRMGGAVRSYASIHIPDLAWEEFYELILPTSSLVHPDKWPGNP
jgi:hypothetical protein